MGPTSWCKISNVEACFEKRFENSYFSINEHWKWLNHTDVSLYFLETGLYCWICVELSFQLDSMYLVFSAEQDQQWKQAPKERKQQGIRLLGKQEWSLKALSNFSKNLLNIWLLSCPSHNFLLPWINLFWNKSFPLFYQRHSWRFSTWTGF